MKLYKLLFFFILICSISCKKEVIEIPVAPLIKCLQTSLVAKTNDETYILTFGYDAKGRRIKRTVGTLTENYYVEEYIYESSKIIHNRKFKDKADYQWIYILNSDGTLANSSRNINGKIETEQYRYNKDGYLIEYVSSLGNSRTYEYADGNVSNITYRFSDGSMSKTTYQYYTDKLDAHDTEYFITPGLEGKGNKNLVKSYTTSVYGGIVTVNESYTFDDRANITQITHDSKDVTYKGVDTYTYDCR